MRGRSIGALGVLAVAVSFAAPAEASKPRLAPAPKVEIPGQRLFDIGVADPETDGWQDIYTTNHKFESAFLRNRSGRSFDNVIDEVGLGPDELFPGLHLLRRPDDSQPGVYIWPTDSTGEAGQLHIASTGLTVTGRMALMTRRMSLISQAGAAASLSYDVYNRPTLDFTIQPGGEVTIASNGLSDLPIAFSFAESGSGAVSPGQIKVGTDSVSPSSATFEFKLRDRHAIAFADVAGDPDQDAFVVTGGLGGGIADPQYLGAVQDQLLVSGAGPNGEYGNDIFPAAILKSTCRGRGASYADPDGRGRLDLLTTCEGQPARLFANVSRGGFVQVTAPRVVGSVYEWAQLDDGPPSLLIGTRRGLEVWGSSTGGTWARVQTVRAGTGAKAVALGDYDNSGTLDALVTGKRGVHLLSNRRGRLRALRGRLGLPAKTEAASFVDYDNDGRLDVSLAPQGLFRWDRRRERFVDTGAAGTPRAGYAIVQWMDFDNDGRRDPLVSTSRREFSPRSRITLRRNVSRSGHWLEVDLHGADPNREAIGGSVTVVARGSGRRVTQWVGQNDDARHSQGHYRLYFGLGRSRKAARVIVRWPGGRTTRLKQVRADRLLTVAERR